MVSYLTTMFPSTGLTTGSLHIFCAHLQGSDNILFLNHHTRKVHKNEPDTKVNQVIHKMSRLVGKQCGFRTGPTQTGLYKHGKELEA